MKLSIINFIFPVKDICNRTILSLLLLFSALNVNIVSAQLVIDDFSKGEFDTKIFSNDEAIPFYQSVSNVKGGKRMFKVIVRQNPFDHNIQITLKDGLLVMSSGFDTKGKLFLNYGTGKQQPSPLKLNLEGYKYLKVEYEAHSTKNGIYVALFSKKGRATYSENVAAREGRMVLKIPMEDFNAVGENFDLKNVDILRFQFGSSSKTGCNMAIRKIWFE